MFLVKSAALAVVAAGAFSEKALGKTQAGRDRAHRRAVLGMIKPRNIRPHTVALASTYGDAIM
jgi:hypothetical protein